jgi:antitoxin CptB
MTETVRRQRLRFRSWHRGTREIDLLLGSFADAHVQGFTGEELGQYDAILQLDDPDLYNWVTGAQPVPEEHDGEVMRLLVAHRFSR